MAPMTRSRSDNPEGAATALTAQYYEQRAGAGLIVTEGTYVSAEAAGYINVPGIYTDAHVAGWRLVTEAVHQKGGKIFAQIWHVGRLSHPDLLNGNLPLAPSALNPNIQGDTTIYYIQKKIQGLNCSITTIARGIAFGGELEYADELTLGRSLQNRMPVDKYISH